MSELAVKLAQDRPLLSSLLILLGSLSVARLTVKTLTAFLQTFLIPGTNLQYYGAKKGSWAVVTGASDGIGREFALQLAKAGFNILLAARNPDALAKVSLEIDQKYGASGVSTKIYTMDFSKNDPDEYAHFAAVCRELDITILVNNVGRGHAMPADFVDTPSEEIEGIVALNVGATLRVTHSVLPGLIKRKRGLILNIGSFAGDVPVPMMATYSASKSFLATFSAALGEEVKEHNILVQNLNTYFVVSKLSKVSRTSWYIPKPDGYVKGVLSKIGLPCGAAFTGRPYTSSPFWGHAVLDFFIHLIDIPSILVQFVHSSQRSVRRRALARKAREAKKM